jgi:hypothetical protein
MSGRMDDRRRAARAAPDAVGWRQDALLRPGLPVRVLDIGPFGALVECPSRLRPGRRAELQLITAATDQKQVVHGRVERCHVARLEPLNFHGAIVFDNALAGRG